jgi:hypothetical protein
VTIHRPLILFQSCFFSSFFPDGSDAQAIAEHARLVESGAEGPPELADELAARDLGCGGAAMARLLLLAGSRPSCANDRGLTAMHVAAGAVGIGTGQGTGAAAVDGAHVPLLARLRDPDRWRGGGCDVDGPDGNGAAPLAHAARAGNARGAAA